MKNNSVSNPPVHHIEDSYFAAFLSLRGHHTKPLKHKNGRIVFEVIGDIAPDVEKYYQNQGVGVLEYINHLKMLRNSIFTMRNLHGNE